MAAAHAGVDDLDVPDILVFALLLDFVELLARLPRLSGFRQIILPAHLPGNFLFIGDTLCFDLIPAHFIKAATVSVNALFFPLVDEDTAKAVFHHIADNPVRREELRDSRDFLLGDLAVLGKGSVLRLGVVILVQPSDDLHLARRLSVLVGVGDVKVLLWNVVGQMIHYTILIHY